MNVSFIHKRKNMSEKFTVKDREELERLIKAMIDRDGPNCDLNFIDVSQITDMSELFYHIQEFNGDISKWDVSNVTNMSGMFMGSRFNGDISQWNVSNVTEMSMMFHGAQFNGDISQWDVSNVTNMVEMFNLAKFNGDISNWNPVSLTDKRNMFFCSSLTPPAWYDKEKVVAEDRNHLEKLIKDTIEKEGPNCNLNFIDVSKVQDMSYLFRSDETLKKFNGNIRGWNVSNVTNMVGMFAESDFAGDLRQWESKFADKVDRTGMFYNAKKFTKEHAKTFAPWCSDGNGSEWEEPIVIPLEINDLVL